jgi:hypothetical protein
MLLFQSGLDREPYQIAVRTRRDTKDELLAFGVTPGCKRQHCQEPDDDSNAESRFDL